MWEILDKILITAYVSIRANSNIETENECVDYQTFIEICNIETKICEFARMSEDELQDRGMNPDQLFSFGKCVYNDNR